MQFAASLRPCCEVGDAAVDEEDEEDNDDESTNFFDGVDSASFGDVQLTMPKGLEMPSQRRRSKATVTSSWKAAGTGKRSAHQNRPKRRTNKATVCASWGLLDEEAARAALAFVAHWFAIFGNEVWLQCKG